MPGTMRTYLEALANARAYDAVAAWRTADDPALRARAAAILDAR